MRVSTTALYTLAALIAGDLTQQAIAQPVLTTAPERPEAGDIESAAESLLPSSIDAVTPPEQLQAIAFAEAVLTQYSEEYTRELTEAVDLQAADIADFVAPADSFNVTFNNVTEIGIAEVEALTALPTPEMMGVEHRLLYLSQSTESADTAGNLADPQADLLTAWALNGDNFSGYQELAVAPPEAIAMPERMPEPEPKLVEAIAIPEFFMPERSERLLSNAEASVNVLLPVPCSSESTQTYALNDLQENEDLWIQAIIESEYAEQDSTIDWVAADLAFEVVQV